MRKHRPIIIIVDDPKFWNWKIGAVLILNQLFHPIATIGSLWWLFCEWRRWKKVPAV